MFRLTEWPAAKVERWIFRAVFGLGRRGVEIPPEVLKLGSAAIAYVIATKAVQMPSGLGIKLADELMECVQRCEEHGDRRLVEQDIEDVTTRLTLKGEVLKLTFGFFGIGDFPSSPESPPPPATPKQKP
jgi:hypothetical protein